MFLSALALVSMTVADQCMNIPLENRTCCGTIGITPTDCVASGCCFDDLHAGTYFCFNKSPTPGKRLNASERICLFCNPNTLCTAPPCPPGLDGVNCDINFTATMSPNDTKFVPPGAGCHNNGTLSKFSMDAQTLSSNVLHFDSANQSQKAVPSVYYGDPIKDPGTCNCPGCILYFTLSVVSSNNTLLAAFCANSNGFHEGAAFTGTFSADVTSWLRAQPNGDYFFGLIGRPMYTCADAVNSVPKSFTSHNFGPLHFGQAIWKVTKV